MAHYRQYAPSPVAEVAQQVQRFEATEGKEGATLFGRPIVILTTRGARTGLVRKTPLIRIEDGGIYAVVASYAGGPRNPQWYYNLLATPDVVLQDGAVLSERVARELTNPRELDFWWSLADLAWPEFPEYRRAAGRKIPILLLEPRPTDPTP